MRTATVFLLCLVVFTARAQPPALMPWPQEIAEAAGNFSVNEDFTVSLSGPASNRLSAYATRFISRVAGRTGLFITQWRPVAGDSAGLQISYNKVAALNLQTDESYQLNIAPSGMVLQANTDVGAMRGLETLLQLLSSNAAGYYFAGYTIKDSPRFVWRGLLLDVCRHWLPMEVVLRNLDAMAAVKMNVLHLHLTEDQGFRIESKVYPKLHEMGSDGNYFTQEEIRKIVAYAAARGIRVVPEFDIPGHTTSWFVGYPELAAAPGPYEIARKYGVHNPTIDPTKEYTYVFLEKFLTEMAGLFPDGFMHIGGDENNGKQWNANAGITKFKENQGLASNHELQAYFNVKVAAILTQLNKRMVGWDEILDEDLPRSIVIQSWRGKQALIDAAEAGYDVLLSNGYYIDLVQPAAYHYQNDPIPAGSGLSAEALQHVLGGEATMWAELVSPETVDSRIWPRTAAIAERFWSPAGRNDTDDMYQRLQIVSVQLEELGLLHRKNYAMMMRRLVGEENVPTLKTLIDVLEPIEGYKRHRARKYRTWSPLTRVPDIAQPDAFVAMAFNKLVDDYLANGSQLAKKQIKEQLLVWVENHKQMRQLANKYPAIKEILPLSEGLSGIAVLGMQALSSTKAHDAAWHQSADRMLADAAKPRAECELKVVTGIAKIVAAVN